jgi:hypothetical protein
MKIELLGLPGVGKSYFFQNTIFNHHLNPRPVELGGLSPAKVWNIAKGALRKPAVLLFMTKMIVLRRSRFDLRKFIILFERIGRLTSGHGAAVDEGPLQAVWGLYYREPLTPNTQESCKNLLRLVFCTDQLIYVYADKATRAINIRERTRKHHTVSMSQTEIAQARAWMFVIVRHLRSERGDFLTSYRVRRTF